VKATGGIVGGASLVAGAIGAKEDAARHYSRSAACFGFAAVALGSALLRTSR
jgi:hypothetical protein